MKRILRSLLARSGYELCRISDAERQDIPQDRHFNYKEVQAYRALTADGQVSIEEARFLSELVRKSDVRRPIVEVGTLYGFSTLSSASRRTQHRSSIRSTTSAGTRSAYLPQHTMPRRKNASRCASSAMVSSS